MIDKARGMKGWRQEGQSLAQRSMHSEQKGRVQALQTIGLRINIVHIRQAKRGF